MKTIIKLSFVLALAMVVNTAIGAGNLSTKIELLDGKKAVVEISSISKSDLKISITDKANNVIYTGNVNKVSGDYRQVFDFSLLEDGNYCLKVESNDVCTSRNFSKNELEIKVQDEKTSIKPYFEFKNGLLRLTYLNFNKESLKLSVYEGNNQLYSKNLNSGFTVNEALKFSGLAFGKYTVVLLAGETEHYFELDIPKVDYAFRK